MSVPHEPMPPVAFEARVFQLAKDPEQAGENQDAWRIDAGGGLAAIADGVASSIFARQWARILVDAVAAGEPDVADCGARDVWLAERRRAWRESIDVESLAWFQKPKLREGAFSTLLWAWLTPQQPQAETPAACRLRAVAVGDSCLFCVRGGEIIRSFPIERSEAFAADPLVVGSVDLGRDELLEFRPLDQPCQEGDLVVLATDAVAEWVLRWQESGLPLEWERFWNMPPEEWSEEINALRAAGEMRFDDATLMLLRVTRRTVSSAGEGAEAACQPPLLPGEAPDDWSGKLKHFSDQVAEEVSQQVSKGIERVRKIKQSAESAIKKYRDKLREDR